MGFFNPALIKLPVRHGVSAPRCPPEGIEVVPAGCGSLLVYNYPGPCARTLCRIPASGLSGSAGLPRPISPPSTAETIKESPRRVFDKRRHGNELSRFSAVPVE